LAGVLYLVGPASEGGVGRRTHGVGRAGANKRCLIGIGMSVGPRRLGVERGLPSVIFCAEMRGSLDPAAVMVSIPPPPERGRPGPPGVPGESPAGNLDNRKLTRA